MNIEELEKKYQMIYNPEGYGSIDIEDINSQTTDLFIQTFPVLKRLSIGEAISLSKEKNIKISNLYIPSDGQIYEDAELACKYLNSL